MRPDTGSSDRVRDLFEAIPDPRPRGPMARRVRRLARLAVLPIVWLMEAGHRFGRVLLRTEYRVEGGCKQRGACCHHILMEWSSWFDRFPWLGRIALWKLTRFYDLYDKGYGWEVQDGLLVRVLGCHALRPDGRCGVYHTRPLFCRTYPEVPLVGRPLVLKGCGYDFARRDRTATAEAPDLVQIGGRSLRGRAEPLTGSGDLRADGSPATSPPGRTAPLRPPAPSPKAPTDGCDRES